MYNALEQQNFPNPEEPSATFASDPAAVVDKPGYPYYGNGVDVGYTAPAKWWNWLWNHISAWLGTSKADRTNMVAEIQNTLSAASIQPSASDSHQLSKSVDIITYGTSVGHNEAEEDGHKVNQPYVVGHTLYIPESELL
jgi:hypothetical protein